MLVWIKPPWMFSVLCPNALKKWALLGLLIVFHILSYYCRNYILQYYCSSFPFSTHCLFGMKYLPTSYKLLNHIQQKCPNPPSNKHRERMQLAISCNLFWHELTISLKLIGKSYSSSRFESKRRLKSFSQTDNTWKSSSLALPRQKLGVLRHLPQMKSTSTFSSFNSFWVN